MRVQKLKQNPKGWRLAEMEDFRLQSNPMFSPERLVSLGCMTGTVLLAG